VHFQVVTPPTTDATSMAVSPDGRKLVFVGSNERRMQLFLRALDSVNAQALPGTEGATYPFWSPNSRSIGFLRTTSSSASMCRRRGSRAGKCPAREAAGRGIKMT